MFRRKKKKICNCSTEGKIIKIESKGLDYPTIMYVEYFVDGKRYEVNESIKLKSSVIKIGPIPIGQKKQPKINTRVGSNVEIKYNSDNPNISYIVDNNGIMNV